MTTDYDGIADHFDRRYKTYRYTGIEEALRAFADGGSVAAILEVGCGTGHWLQVLGGAAPLVAGLEPSRNMMARARSAAPSARLVRARAEALPFADAAFDRVFCVNALHHFADRRVFFAEARRVLRPGGAVLTIGLDPHALRFGQPVDSWWVYDYFDGTREADLARFPPARTIRNDITWAGFAWTETTEADHIERLTPAGDALAGGLVDRRFTSQLSDLPDQQFEAGVERLRREEQERAAAGDSLQVVTDLHFFATVGWV